MRTIILMLGLACMANAQPPQAPVPPQAPAIDDRIAALEARMDSIEQRLGVSAPQRCTMLGYTEFRERIAQGESGTLCIDCQCNANCSGLCCCVDSMAGKSSGKYRCYLDRGNPVMTPIDPVSTLSFSQPQVQNLQPQYQPMIPQMRFMQPFGSNCPDGNCPIR